MLFISDISDSDKRRNVGASGLDLVAEIVRCRPTYTVCDYALYVCIVERRAGLMTGLEVEHTSRAAEEGASGAENISVLIPSLEDMCVGLRNLEGLSVKLLFGKLEMCRDTCRNRMRRHDVPVDLLLIVTPEKVARGADDCAEGLGMMRAVECDKAHAADINSLADALNEIVLDFAVVHVTPPKKDIGIIEHLIRQSLIGIVKRRKVMAALLDRLCDEYDGYDQLSKDKLNKAVAADKILDALMKGPTPIRTNAQTGEMMQILGLLRDVSFESITAYVLPGGAAKSGSATYFSPNKAELLTLLNESFNPYGREILDGDLQLAALSGAKKSALHKQTFAEIMADQSGEVTATTTAA